MRTSPAASNAFRALGSAVLVLFACAAAGCGSDGSGSGGSGAGSSSSSSSGSGGADGGSEPICTKSADACTEDAQCCSSYCSHGEVGELPAGTCCVEDGLQCESSSDCCTAGGCDQGICQTAPGTIVDGYVCDFDGDCLSGNCSDEKVCAPPE
jgi:hypothetical protein